MQTLKNNPELMIVICNIQNLKSKIYSDYDPYSDFKNLEKLTSDQLYNLQDQLIPEYNKALTGSPAGQKTFTVTYDFNVFKPSNFEVYQQQKLFSLTVTGSDLRDAKENFLKSQNKNPMYFKFQENN